MNPLTVVTGSIVKKYRLTNRLRSELGVSRQCAVPMQMKHLAVVKKSRLLEGRNHLRQHITNFLELDENSTCLPSKRDAKKVDDEKVQKRVLNDYMHNLHMKYLAQNPDKKVSRSFFYTCRKANYVCASFGVRQTCLCLRRQNMSLKLEHDDNESWWLAEDVKGQVGYVPAAYLMIILDETHQEEESRKEGHDKRTDGTKIGGEMGQDGERRKSYSAAVIDGCERTSTIYVGDSIVRKTDRSLSKGKDVVVCLPGARIEHVTERVKKIMERGNGGSIVVHVGTNNADKEGTTAILEKYRDLLKKTKQARVGQIIISGILPVFGNKIQGYRNSKRMAVNGMVERLCKEEDVGYMDLWDSFVGNEDMYVRDGRHLSGKGAAVFAEGLSGAVASGLGKVRYLN